MTEWLQEALVCPVDHSHLQWSEDRVTCPKGGHEFPIIERVPVMLRDDVEHTQWVAAEAIDQSKGLRPLRQGTSTTDVDWFVQDQVAATSGYLYEPLRGRLNKYPIPDIRLTSSEGARLLDIGCNWGRWCIAAALKGYRPVGIDPSLDACLAARRVAHHFGIELDVVVGDARFLPFRTESFQTAFSYSVLQHFSRPDALQAIQEIRRVIASGGQSLIQMANKFGARSGYHQARRRFRQAREFEVRYWSPRQLTSTFNQHIGPSSLEIDAFLGLGSQAADFSLMPVRFKIVIGASELGRLMGRVLPPLRWIADSLYVRSVRL